MAKLHHARTRYVYNLYYVRSVISRELYEWLLEQAYADRQLIAKWKKNGYEKLCCLSCIQTSDHNFGTTCICRIPKAELEEDRIIECVTCGCRGCASTDVPGRTSGGPNARQRRKERRKNKRAAHAANASPYALPPSSYPSSSSSTSSVPSASAPPPSSAPLVAAARMSMLQILEKERKALQSANPPSVSEMASQAVAEANTLAAATTTNTTTPAAAATTTPAAAGEENE